MIHASIPAPQVGAKLTLAPRYSIGDNLHWVSRATRATVFEIVATIHADGTDIGYGCDTPLGMEVIPENDLA
jgi:hypothetical protein